MHVENKAPATSLVVDLVCASLAAEALRYLVEGMSRDAAESFARAGIASKTGNDVQAQAELARAKKLLGLLANVDMDALP